LGCSGGSSPHRSRMASNMARWPGGWTSQHQLAEEGRPSVIGSSGETAMAAGNPTLMNSRSWFGAANQVPSRAYLGSSAQIPSERIIWATRGEGGWIEATQFLVLFWIKARQER
jgi:hypothetical protein